MTQRDLASRVGVSVSYISKVESERLHFGDYPSEKFVERIAEVLRADLDELMLLTERVPETIRRRVAESPAEFMRLAALSDGDLRRVVASLDKW